MNAKKAQVLWFTGLSGSGKTTLVQSLEGELIRKGFQVKVLDGDDIRRMYGRDLGFSREGIKKNNHFVVELCFREQPYYDFILVAMISPFEDLRGYAKEKLGLKFSQVYIKASLGVCIKRDVKGLYKKALQGEITNFIGLDPQVSYEIPKKPDLILNTEVLRVDQCVDQLISFLKV